MTTPLAETIFAAGLKSATKRYKMALMKLNKENRALQIGLWRLEDHLGEVDHPYLEYVDFEEMGLL